MKKILTILTCITLSFNASAYELNAYAKAIPFYGYITDISTLLDVSVKRNNWTLVKDKEDQFQANISHKGYDIKTALVVKDNAVSIVLLSAERVACNSNKKCKYDEDKVQGWLLRLRKSLAYDITIAVRKSLLKQSVNLS